MLELKLWVFKQKVLIVGRTITDVLSVGILLISTQTTLHRKKYVAK